MNDIKVEIINGKTTSSINKFVNGKHVRHGIHAEYENNKVIIECYFIDDLLDGPLIKFDKNGDWILFEEYSKGKLHGLRMKKINERNEKRILKQRFFKGHPVPY